MNLKPPTLGWKAIVAIGLVVFSFILFVLIPVVPFLPISTAMKGIAGTSLFIVSEIAFWLAVLIGGADLVKRISRKLGFGKLH